MAKKKRLVVMISSTVYGIEELLARIYTILIRFGYSHPIAPNIPKQELEQAIDAVGNFLKLAVQK